MASVIRIKRRRTDDPAEALLLSHIKKSRTTEVESELDKSVESVLEFAGTLDSKDESISKHIKEAIRKKKIHKQMHPHSSDFKIPLERDDLTNRLRKQKAESSHNKRYRITCSRRALDIDNLDSCKETDENQENSSENAHTHKDDDQLRNRLLHVENNKENAKIVPDTHAGLKSQKDSSVPVVDIPEHTSKVTSPKVLCGAICGRGNGDKEGEKIYCLIDVERDKQSDVQATPTTSASAITVNGIPMKPVQTAVTTATSTSTTTTNNGDHTKTKVPVMEESDDYVYDLYYTHTRLGHIRDEAVLTVEALCHEFLHEERANEGDDFVYDDDDDSNDEGNWRNDYPDEDPHFFENAEKDYDYENNMRESNFDDGDDDDDEGDLLSYWMDTRCKIDVDCKDFEDDDYAKDRSSSDEEAGAELGYY